MKDYFMKQLNDGMSSNIQANAYGAVGGAGRYGGKKTSLQRYGSQRPDMGENSLFNDGAMLGSPNRSVVLNGSKSIQHATSTYELRFQRSQANIDRKIKEDFDRLQEQVKRRQEKEKTAEEI